MYYLYVLCTVVLSENGFSDTAISGQNFDFFRFIDPL